MHAILRIDLKPGVGAIGILDDLIDTRRTIVLLGRAIERVIYRNRLGRIAQAQMGRLIFLVIRIGYEDRGQPVEADFTIGLGVNLGCDAALALGGFVILMGMLQGPGRLAAQQDLIDPGMERAQIEAPFEGRADIANLVLLVP